MLIASFLQRLAGRGRFPRVVLRHFIGANLALGTPIIIWQVLQHYVSHNQIRRLNKPNTVLIQTEKRLVCQISVAQRLLQPLVIHLAQPRRFRLPLEVHQLGFKITCGQSLFGFRGVRFLAPQGPIPNPPPRTRIPHR